MVAALIIVISLVQFSLFYMNILGNCHFYLELPRLSIYKWKDLALFAVCKDSCYRVYDYYIFSMYILRILALE